MSVAGREPILIGFAVAGVLTMKVSVMDSYRRRPERRGPELGMLSPGVRSFALPQPDHMDIDVILIFAGVAAGRRGCTSGVPRPRRPCELLRPDPRPKVRRPKPAGNEVKHIRGDPTMVPFPRQMSRPVGTPYFGQRKFKWNVEYSIRLNRKVVTDTNPDSLAIRDSKVPRQD